MRTLLIMAVLAIIIATTSQVSGHRGGNHFGRGGGQRSGCLASACEKAKDAAKCRTCIQNLKSSGSAPRQAIHNCHHTNNGCGDPAAFKTCISNANKDIAACLA
ncbi:uncharacterized protein LOC135210491 [Macrobrachium nipponense]|uniref:uncharacterized protein LOC135210491 n=1 Tax=Macrobrachium nipponense TaxID=159736 RepID=UPI0030C86E24